MQYLPWFSRLIKISANWISALSGIELGQWRDRLYDGINIIQFIHKSISGVMFQTTLRQDDLLSRYGAKIVFVVKHKNLNNTFYQYSNNVVNGIKIDGYIKSSGFSEQLYRLSDGKYIPAELEPWVFQFDGAENIIQLIGYNVTRQVEKELVKKKYFSLPVFQELLREVNSKDLPVKQAVELFKRVPLNIPMADWERTALQEAFVDWWWARKGKAEQWAAIEKAIENMATEEGMDLKQTGNITRITAPKGSNYDYDLTLTPQQGKGKYLTLEMVEQAYRIYGEDFKVVIKYQNGPRMIYLASQIINWVKSGLEDDEAYEFFNQNGGIRELWIAG